MNKEKALETIKKFPPEFDLDELMERLFFVEKVERGLIQLKEGKTITHDKVKEIVKKW